MWRWRREREREEDGRNGIDGIERGRRGGWKERRGWMEVAVCGCCKVK